MHFCIICNSFDKFHNTVLQHFDCRFDKCWQMNYMWWYLIQSDNRNISIHSHSKWLSVILYRLNYDWQMDIHRSTVFDILIDNAMVFELNKYFFELKNMLHTTASLCNCYTSLRCIRLNWSIRTPLHTYPWISVIKCRVYW
jgi:hypothetical protein